jgi:hypothetical protein
LPATIHQLPDRLTWDTSAPDLLADAFAPDGRYLGSYRIMLIGCLWCVAYLPPFQGAAVEQCGSATTAEGAKAIADSHRRRLG